MGSRLRYERGLRAALLSIALMLAACPEQAPPRDVSGVGGEPTDYIGAGGAPPIPIAGVSGTAAGAGSQPPPESDGAGAVAAGNGGEPPAADRVFNAGTAADRNNVKAGALCERLAQIQCAGEEYCCEDPGRDRAACELSMRKACIEEVYLDAVSGNMITGFDEAVAAVTFTEVERLASICDPNIVSFSISRDGFMAMFRGTTAAGASCMPTGNNKAVAAARLVSCTDISTVACLPMSLLSWRCSERGGAGKPCFTDVNCVDGFFCPNVNGQVGRTSCEARKPVGAACRKGNECASLFCEAGACVPQSQRNAYCLKLSE